jgi:hypothetical protein
MSFATAAGVEAVTVGDGPGLDWLWSAPAIEDVGGAASGSDVLLAP